MPATTHISNHTHFEIPIPFRVCSKPLPHEEVRRILQDPPESSGICNLPPVKPNLREGPGDLFIKPELKLHKKCKL